MESESGKMKAKTIRILLRKAKKLDKILDVFQNQPSQVIQWTPDKQHYSWNYPFTSKGEEMLHKTLEIILEEDVRKRERKEV